MTKIPKGPMSPKKALRMGANPMLEGSGPGVMPMMKKGGKVKHKAKGGSMGDCSGMKKGGHVKHKGKKK